MTVMTTTETGMTADTGGPKSELTRGSGAFLSVLLVAVRGRPVNLGASGTLAGELDAGVGNSQVCVRIDVVARPLCYLG
jgi:hypothetical protein